MMPAFHIPIGLIFLAGIVIGLPISIPLLLLLWLLDKFAPRK